MFGRASGYNWRAVSVALGPVCLEGPLVTTGGLFQWH